MRAERANSFGLSKRVVPDNISRKPLSVLHVNFDDLPGRRFNGLDARAALVQHDIFTSHFVAHKVSDDPNVATLQSRWIKALNKRARWLEKRLSLQAMLHATTRELMSSQAFENADVIHLHIVHMNYFSLASLPRLAKARPIIWTLHDPWALTGHCVHPLDCQRWEIGCGSCPHLDTDLRIRRDTTAFLFRYKAWAYRNAEFEIVVASPWLERMVERSPLLKDKRRHLLPFGVDLNIFRPGDKARARAKLGLPNDKFVICLREEGQPFKGVAQVLPALEILAERGDIRLVTLGRADMLSPIADRFSIRRFGWISEPDAIADIYRAADLFVMPSVAESFGMMAVESIACGTPVVCLEGTALEHTIATPEVGVAAPRDNPPALAAAIARLLDTPAERQARTAAGLNFVRREYSLDTHARRMETLYREVHARWMARSRNSQQA